MRSGLERLRAGSQSSGQRLQSDSRPSEYCLKKNLIEIEKHWAKLGMDRVGHVVVVAERRLLQNLNLQGLRQSTEKAELDKVSFEVRIAATEARTRHCLALQNCEAGNRGIQQVRKVWTPTETASLQQRPNPKPERLRIPLELRRPKSESDPYRNF